MTERPAPTRRSPSRRGHAAAGSRVLVGATHCDPTVNLYGGYHVAAGDGTLAHWPIVGRYGLQTPVTRAAFPASR